MINNFRILTASLLLVLSATSWAALPALVSQHPDFYERHPDLTPASHVRAATASLWPATEATPKTLANRVVMGFAPSLLAMT